MIKSNGFERKNGDLKSLQKLKSLSLIIKILKFF